MARVVREEIVDDGPAGGGWGWNPLPGLVAVVAVVILVLLLWAPISRAVHNGNKHGSVKVTVDHK
jgi:hypothetical protein